MSTKHAIYLAAPFARRVYLREEIAPALRAMGHQITSGWINEPPEHDEIADYLRARRRGEVGLNLSHEKYLRSEATRDVMDVANANMLMRFPAANGLTPSSGGKFVETGLAVAYNLTVVVIGNRECVFDYLPFVKVFADFDEAVVSLGLEV